MHPTMRYELAKARIADLHQEAQRDALARAARQARRAARSEPAHRLPALRAVLARRVLTVLRPRTTP